MDASRIFSRLPIKGPTNDSTLDGANYLIKLDESGLIDAAYLPASVDISEISGDLIIGGNLVVNGATTTISSETLTINDNVIVLNNNVSSGSPTENGGILVRRGASTSASLLWDEGADNWKIGLSGSEVAIANTTDVSNAISTHAADQTIHLTSSQNTWIDAITATSTEINYLSGVSSNVQTQMNTKAPAANPTFTGTVVLPSNTSIGSVSATELGYIDGVTSAIQTQLDAKAALSGATFTGTINVPSVVANNTGATIKIKGLTGSEATYGGLWINQGSPSSSNYNILGSSTETYINAVTQTVFKINGATVASLNGSALSMSIPASFNGGALIPTPSGTSIVADNEAMSLAVFRQKWVTSKECAITIDSTAFQTDSSGAGSSAQTVYGLGRCVGGTDGGGRASLFKRCYANFNVPGGAVETINFSKPMWMSITFSAGYNIVSTSSSLSSNGTARFTLGKQSATGTLTNKGFGIEVFYVNDTTANFRLLTHDGSSLYTSPSLADIDFQAYAAGASVYPIIHNVTLYNDGAGGMNVWLNNTHVYTTSTCPTGVGPNEVYFVFEVQNNGDTVPNEAYFHELRWAIGN